MDTLKHILPARQTTSLLLVLWLVSVTYPMGTSAQLSPGPLSRAHTSLEGLTNCTLCHTLGEGVSDMKCLDCHDVMGKRRSQILGFHTTVRDTSCTACHSDHNGEAFDMIQWPEGGMLRFDHTRTGFPLVQAHQRAACRDCHNKSRVKDPVVRSSSSVGIDSTFLGLSAACSACHVDVHEAKLGSQCASCHGADAWRPAPGFDHAATGFLLEDGHGSLKCVRCHVSDVGKEVPSAAFPAISVTCASCHKTPHSDRISDDCQSCHLVVSWRKQKSELFDHSKTNFALTGRHENVPCQKCHAETQAWKRAGYGSCAGCHEDVHRGQFVDGNASCERCHDASGFVPSLFSLTEHRETRFPLEGAHGAVPCVLCHDRSKRGVGLEFAWTEPVLRCQTCHSSPHGEAYQERVRDQGCEVCHSVSSWRKTAFDHSVTAFPLVGPHADAKCARCHNDHLGAFVDRKFERCEVCHDDVHAGQFSEVGHAACERCHTSDSWAASGFIHNRDARFFLDGAHVTVACEACHPVFRLNGRNSVRYKPLGDDCAFCHGK